MECTRHTVKQLHASEEEVTGVGLWYNEQMYVGGAIQIATEADGDEDLSVRDEGFPVAGGHRRALAGWDWFYGGRQGVKRVRRCPSGAN